MSTETTPTPETKPGFKTSEFWLIIATNVAGILAAVGGALPAEKAGMLLVISNGIYAISRGLAKKPSA